MHNRPGGDPTPSRAGIEMTRVIVEAAEPLGIAVLESEWPPGSNPATGRRPRGNRPDDPHDGGQTMTRNKSKRRIMARRYASGRARQDGREDPRPPGICGLGAQTGYVEAANPVYWRKRHSDQDEVELELEL
jgi:hypothetical protein